MFSDANNISLIAVTVLRHVICLDLYIREDPAMFNGPRHKIFTVFNVLYD